MIAPAPSSVVTQYAYDNEGQLRSVTDGRGLTTTYTYNGFGDVISRSSPDTGTSTFTYDSASLTLVRLPLVS